MSAAPFATVAVEPCGMQRTFAHVNTTDPRTHGFQRVDMPVYPDEPRGKALRDLRVACGLGLREAAAILGIRAVRLSNVESGSERFVRDEAYDEAARLMDGAA